MRSLRSIHSFLHRSLHGRKSSSPKAAFFLNGRTPEIGKLKPSRTAPDHPKYPYLLRGRKITKADEVWAIDITYIPWSKGHVYLVAIIDWKARSVLVWQVSNTMDVDFCLDVLCEAVGIAGTVPTIINTDQGSQFTGVEWLSAVESVGAQVSMDGRGRWMDNVLIERLWRSVKHEWLFLQEYNTIPELEALLSERIERYNTWRPHTANGGQTPWQAYRGLQPKLEREELTFAHLITTTTSIDKFHCLD